MFKSLNLLVKGFVEVEKESVGGGGGEDEVEVFLRNLVGFTIKEMYEFLNYDETISLRLLYYSHEVPTFPTPIFTPIPRQ